VLLASSISHLASGSGSFTERVSINRPTYDASATWARRYWGEPGTSRTGLALGVGRR
jgi:hypothetical protein